MMANKILKIKDITIPKGKRKINKEVVTKLSSSISEIGLLHPIIVSKDMNLIAGQHRLEAMKMNQEVMIDARVVDITFNDDMVATIELDENDSRAELSIRDKVALVKEISRLRDARVSNKGNQYTKMVSASCETDTISTKERNEKTRTKRQAEAKEAGFKNKNEADRCKQIVNNGTDELIDSVDLGEVSVAGGYAISRLPKEEQNDKVELAKNNQGRVVDIGEKEKNTVQEKKNNFKKQDKFGAYINVKIYTSDIKRTSDNIAKCFGNGFEKVYNLLLHEMILSLSFGQNRNKDLSFNSYSYGIKSLSDGEVAEIKELLLKEMKKKDIAELYNISSHLIEVANKITLKENRT